MVAIIWGGDNGSFFVPFGVLTFWRPFARFLFYRKQPQTLLGFIVLLINIKNKHYFYHGAIITERNVPSSVSLGMFVFTTTNPMKDKRTKNKIPDEELSKRLLVHEYGHTIQSLIFGPLYLIVMGIPSTLWGFLPYFQNKRNNGVSYFSFFTEKLANYLGEKVTKEKSMENAII